MFYRHVIVLDDNQEILYLYVDNAYEFANDLGNSSVSSYGSSNDSGGTMGNGNGNASNGASGSDKESGNSRYQNIYSKIIEYIKTSGMKFDGEKVFLVVNNSVVASLTINRNDLGSDKQELVKTLNDNTDDDIEILDVDDFPSIKLIDLNRSSGIIERMKLEDYVFGIVGGEMPGVFNIEAMKAQAVIARTYALKQLRSGRAIRDYNETQIFRDNKYLKLLWGDNYDMYKEKIQLAINSTKGQVLKFDGELIDAYYHLTNNGKTENSKNILKIAYPYLVSVPSVWDLTSPSYLNKRRVSNEYLSKLLNTKIDSDTYVEILSRTESSRVKYIKFNDKVFDGFLLGSKLGLPSNDYSIDIGSDETVFTTRGFGHGLGLSKYGANGMAKEGYNYKQILEYYFPNTYIDRVS